MKAILNDWKFVLLACLTLGLAPYYPEPHILSKLRWVGSGARGMQMKDLADLAVHGIPWLLLIRLFARNLFYAFFPKGSSGKEDG
ncbi:MAG: hypothetical protein IPH16_05605 [Haliscomenobacter sp.]|nr:hypothetical protein [Haliscomenobacter sp.]MBK7475501.1 hypothetical protein [Haliscomenobacter sp.]MBK8878797.1 hypothetical protein [Haliscomenobacter sp.]